MLFAFAAAVAALSCPAEHARYALRTAPGITAEFRAVDNPRGADGIANWPSGLAFAIHLARTGRTYWFLPAPGGTNDAQYLVSTSAVTAPGWAPPDPDGRTPRPLGQLDYLATDARYTVIDAIPQRGGPAPAHILVPGLGSALWHQPRDLDPRDGAPKQFFDLVGCSAHPRR